jgi:beta-lactamase class A
MQRATFLITAATVTVAGQRAAAFAPFDTAAFAALEQRYGGRLGVAILDTGAGAQYGHRAGEGFPMCSTFKLLAVAAVLHNIERGNDSLARPVPYLAADVLAYAPIAKERIGRRAVASMTIAELCAAAIEWSDNTAANLLLHAIAGPGGVTRFARAIGDPVTRLDRDEPALNSAIPGDPRDTTTPAAMARTINALLFGSALSPASRVRLATWLRACRTGTDDLRAGLPPAWRSHCGDKTGSGDRATRNDVAFITLPRRAPLIVTAYYTGSRATDDQQTATLAAVGRLIGERFG